MVTRPSRGSVVYTQLDGSGRRFLGGSPVFEVRKPALLAVDPSTRRLFFLELINGTLSVRPYDGESRTLGAQLEVRLVGFVWRVCHEAIILDGG